MSTPPSMVTLERALRDAAARKREAREALEQRVVAYRQANPEMTRRDVAVFFGISVEKVAKILRGAA